MGLRAQYLEFIESAIEKAFGDAQNLRMLELGDQVINDRSIKEKTGKAYFTNRGFQHVSVDIKKYHGELIRDLREPEQFRDLMNSWDVITNSGTTEHVEPVEKQYECFRIIHDCLKVGGIAVHLNPDVEARDNTGMWKDHCRVYYSISFHKMLAQECGYEILGNTVINGLRCAAVEKTKDAPFMQDRANFLEQIAERDVDLRALRFFRTLKRRIRGEVF